MNVAGVIERLEAALAHLQDASRQLAVAEQRTKSAQASVAHALGPHTGTGALIGQIRDGIRQILELGLSPAQDKMRETIRRVAELGRTSDAHDSALRPVAELAESPAGTGPADQPVSQLGGRTPRQVAAGRAEGLQAQLPEGARGRVTMAAGVLHDPANDQYTVVVGTSEPRGYLRPGVTPQPGEVVAAGNGHAETDIIRWADANRYSVVTVGAGRPICHDCDQAIASARGVPATEVRRR